MPCKAAAHCSERNPLRVAASLSLVVRFSTGKFQKGGDMQDHLPLTDQVERACQKVTELDKTGEYRHRVPHAREVIDLARRGYQTYDGNSIYTELQ